jgi:hypothetical protein
VVSVVHLAKGNPATLIREFRLDEDAVPAISSRLRPKPERADPKELVSNRRLSFLGSKIYGQGFLLTPAERQNLLEKEPFNSECIFPYLGGVEVNSSPTQSYHRYVISFGQMALEEAERWPDLIEIVREKVKPERDRNKRKIRREYWWRFGEVVPALYKALRPLDRALVCAQVSKHLIISFQPTDRIFSQKLVVFPMRTYTSFTVLQSRVHETWVWLVSSTMKTDLNYSSSDCFETYPSPHPDPRTEIPELEAIGEKLYEARARYLVDTDKGLTQCYNRLKDPREDDPRIVELRELHEEMDRAVLAAYGWSDIEVPSYTTPETDAERRARDAFEDEVIDRLFVLNAERAEEERRLGLAASAKEKKKTGGRPRKAKNEGQGGLFD